MGAYFLDSSAIVKRYLREQGHAWVVTLCDPAQGHELYISQAALVEVVATICRKSREQRITIGLISVAMAEGFIVENPNNYP